LWCNQAVDGIILKTVFLCSGTFAVKQQGVAIARENMVRKEARAAKPSAGSMRLEAFKKTRLCKFYVAGNCVRGTSCNFAHDADQIREPPDFSKTRLCAEYLQAGWCRDGHYCKFAHGEHELRPHPSVKPKEQKMKVEEEQQDVEGWYMEE
jgi:hypothetical protein